MSTKSQVLKIVLDTGCWLLPGVKTGSLQSYIRHFRKQKETGAEMRPAIVSGIATGDAPVSYWSIFSLTPVTIPEVFARVNSIQFPSSV